MSAEIFTFAGYAEITTGTKLMGKERWVGNEMTPYEDAVKKFVENFRRIVDRQSIGLRFDNVQDVTNHAWLEFGYRLIPIEHPASNVRAIKELLQTACLKRPQGELYPHDVFSTKWYGQAVGATILRVFNS